MTNDKAFKNIGNINKDERIESNDFFMVVTKTKEQQIKKKRESARRFEQKHKGIEGKFNKNKSREYKAKKSRKIEKDGRSSKSLKRYTINESGKRTNSVTRIAEKRKGN